MGKLMCICMTVILLALIGWGTVGMLVEPCNPSDPVETSAQSMDNILTDITYDEYNNIIQKTVFDKITGNTFIYTFTYVVDGWGTSCTSSTVKVINSKGELIKWNT